MASRSRAPGPRPLDPFPLRVDGDRVEIGTHAICPDNIDEPWCGTPNAGPHMLDPGYAVVFTGGVRPMSVLAESGLRAGDSPTRRLTTQELRAYGFTVVSTLDDVDMAVRTGARVVWIDSAMIDRVPAQWASDWHRAGVSIGVLDGTIADLSAQLGLGSNAPGWIQPESGRPVFALAMSNGQSSDWLTVSWLLARSQKVSNLPRVDSAQQLGQGSAPYPPP